MRFIRKTSYIKQLRPTLPECIQNYRLSAFCIKEHTDEGILLCHTVTGELLLLTDAEYAELTSEKAFAFEWTRSLANHLFLVDPELNEYAMIDRERLTLATAREKNGVITSYTILPTSRCNARCFYCYEKNIPQKNMSEPIALDTADFIAKNCGGQKVHLSWFGGEPMVAYPIISLICNRLKDLGVAFSSSMISNGLLLTEERIQTAKQYWKLENIQITIDGTEQIYNKTKNYKGQQSNPFEVVLTNISNLINNGIHVSIRINLGMHNYNDITNLISYLDGRFIDRKQLSVYVHEIDNFYDSQDHGELIKKSFDLNQRLIKMGLHKPRELPSLRFHSCMADSDDALLINPDGQLGKCEHYAFEKLIGSIYSTEKDISLVSEWKEKATYDLCGCCPLYASCYQLKWCNGSLPCSESTVKCKIAAVRSSMRTVYKQWRKNCQQIRTELLFRLNGKMDVYLEAGEIYADFCKKESNQIRETRKLNSTACAILLYLQEEHSYKELATMLKEKYIGENHLIEQYLEDYLMNMLQDRLISSCKKENI